MSPASDTIAALATPVGTSAIAVLRASGPKARDLARSLWPELPEPRRACRGDYRRLDGTLLDDVVYTWFEEPNSYTGEDTLEIFCHGNPLIAQGILEDMFSRGCRPAEPGEFTKRAFLHGRMDLSQAEAVMDLIHARSERALASANQLLRGALGRRMDDLIRRLLDILARIEAYIDFPEEDLPTENRAALLRDMDELIAATGRLLATNHYGNILRDGIRTVIVGETNAGKSSLLNRLVGRDRALVSAEPGTTRDYLEERILIGPHYLRLIDTAGLNLQPSDIERRGIEKTLEQASGADLYLWVVDINRPFPALPATLKDRLTPRNTVVVLNKIDIADPGKIPALPDGFPTVRSSALVGTGFDQLEAAIAGLADSFGHSVGDDLVAINARHSLSLEAARTNLGSAKIKLDNDLETELIASDLRTALDAFGEISGRIDNERMLDRLFACFCIGK